MWEALRMPSMIIGCEFFSMGAMAISSFGLISVEQRKLASLITRRPTFEKLDMSPPFQWFGEGGKTIYHLPNQ